MKLRNVLFATTLVVGSSVSAQVGIGNPNPDSSSVLDLTNPNNKGLILPVIASPTSMATSPVGLVYFFNDKIFYKESGDYNALSPWKYKYGAANLSNENVYYDGSGKIGIGMPATDIPQATLHIKPNVTVSLSSNGSLMIGDIATNNLAINGEAIQSRSNGSFADLTINDAGGNVKVGGKLQEKTGGTYYDLVPSGTIVMWSGTTAPGGWAICNGSSGTPDLRNRFVVGAGATYSVNTTGGSDYRSLSTSNMPSHSHSSGSLGGSTSTAGSHSHQQYGWFDGNDSGSGERVQSRDRRASEGPYYGGDAAGNHSHSLSISGSTGAAGSGTSFDIRPQYKAIYYIMKL